jgi:predicted metal-dependent HD superfamily phosphohydrolase
VVDAAKALSEVAQLGEEEKEVLILSALFHDIGFGIDPDNHEYHSEQQARIFLIEHQYPERKIVLISKCILATKKEWQGEDKLCCLMKDADLSGLASPDYNNRAEKLRKELNATHGLKIDQYDWLKENINFIQNHSYFTEEGKRLFNKGKLENLNTLKHLEDEKKKKKKDKLLTIGSSKSAQTQLKTALRNHIDLSSIADNKANIMLSVNAIVITVGIPILIDKSYTHPDMIIPTSIVAIASLISMIFATLSTRPTKMKGVTSHDMIMGKQSNLFFFGNYFKMNFKEYEEGMRVVVGDNEILDNSITRDLFYLGKSLGHKYEYLRWCYNIFMYGIAMAMLSFIIVLLV